MGWRMGGLGGRMGRSEVVWFGDGMMMGKEKRVTGREETTIILDYMGSASYLGDNLHLSTFQLCPGN